MRAKLFVANGVYRLELRRIRAPDLDALFKRHSLGTKVSCPRSLGNPTSRIRSNADEQVLEHDEFLEILALEAVRRGQMDAPEAQSPR